MTIPSESTERSKEYYIGLSYPIEIQKAEEGGFVVSIPTLPGCVTQVEKWEEAESSIESVRREWIRTAYEDGLEIPLPDDEKRYSGKLVLRIPKSMHHKLDMRAEDEGVSLNTLMVSMLAQCLGGQKTGMPSPIKNVKLETGWRRLHYSLQEKPTIRDRTLEQPVTFGNIGSGGGALQQADAVRTRYQEG